jgi:uncharacterized protein (TIGR02147 family)
MKKMHPDMPQIFEYNNYREFLAAFYRHQKTSQASFSYRFFARMAGFKSPNFLKLVIEGKRNLTDESIEGFVTALKLNREAAQFFRSLVNLNQARDSESRRVWTESLRRTRFYRKISSLNPAQYAYHSKWYHVPIRELVGLATFQEDPIWIAQAVIPMVTPTQARQAIETLMELKLITRAEDGRLRQSDGWIATDDKVSSTYIREFHRNMIELSAQAVDRFPLEERHISTLTLGVSKEMTEKIKKLVQKFHNELMAIAATEKNPTEVIELNIQLFPVARPEPFPKGEKK